MKYLFGCIDDLGTTNKNKINHEENLIFDEIYDETKIYAESNCPSTIHIKLENKIYLFYGRIKDFDVKTSKDLINITKDVSDTDFLNNLDGSFACCLYDINKKKLLIKTDSFGQVPVYYCFNNNKFIFSTDINHIHNSGIKKEVDKVKVAEYLQFIHHSANRTYFHGIKKITSKELITLDFSCKYKIISNYYDICNETKNNDGTMVYRYLRKSLNNSYESKKSKGVFLSGGIDSSSVLGIISKFYPDQKISSYSFIFPFKDKNFEEKSCEKFLIDEVANNFKTKHTELNGVNKNPFEYIDLSLSLTNTPSFFTNIYLFIDILEKAKNDDIDIMYSGIGGDSVISWGYESIRENFIKFKLMKFCKQVYNLSKSRKIKISLIFKRIIYQEVFFEKFKNITTNILKFFGFFPGIKNYINKDLILESNLVKKNVNAIPLNAKKYHNYIINAPDHEINNEILYHIFNYYNVEHIAPFYDVSLINYCCGVNHEKKIDDGIERAYFRKALEGEIPDSIRNNQTKANIGISFLLNFVKHGKNKVKSNLLHPHPDLSKFIEVNKFLKRLFIFDLVDDHEIVKNSHTIIEIYLVYVLNEWLKKNF